MLGRSPTRFQWLEFWPKIIYLLTVFDTSTTGPIHLVRGTTKLSSPTNTRWTPVGAAHMEPKQPASANITPSTHIFGQHLCGNVHGKLWLRSIFVHFSKTHCWNLKNLLDMTQQEPQHKTSAKLLVACGTAGFACVWQLWILVLCQRCWFQLCNPYDDRVSLATETWFILRYPARLIFGMESYVIIPSNLYTRLINPMKLLPTPWKAY